MTETQADHKPGTEPPLTPEEAAEFLDMYVQSGPFDKAVLNDKFKPLWDAQQQAESLDEYFALGRQRCRTVLAYWQRWRGVGQPPELQPAAKELNDKARAMLRQTALDR